MISPDAPIHLNSPLIDKFSETFPQSNLIRVISDFALPTSLGQKCNPLCHPAQQSHLVQTIIWMLQHHLLLQLHTYIQYIPTDHGLAAPRDKDERIVIQRNVLSSNSYHPSTSEHSRAESESGTSTVSETPELRSESDLINRSIKLVV